MHLFSQIEITLKFPSETHINDFIRDNDLTSLEVDYDRLLIKGLLTEDEIDIARNDYYAAPYDETLI